jgi:hypothetical protein
VNKNKNFSLECLDNLLYLFATYIIKINVSTSSVSVTYLNRQNALCSNNLRQKPQSYKMQSIIIILYEFSPKSLQFFNQENK